MKKSHGILLGVFILIVLLVLIVPWRNVRAFPYIISAFYSKEFCSCYFIVREDETFCHHYARQWVPISNFELDKEIKKVTVTGLGKTTSARFTNSKFGCVLDPWEAF